MTVQFQPLTTELPYDTSLLNLPSSLTHTDYNNQTADLGIAFTDLRKSFTKRETDLMASLDTVDILHCIFITIVVLTFVLFTRISKTAVANSWALGWF